MNSILQNLYYGHLDPHSETLGLPNSRNEFSDKLRSQAPDLWSAFDILMDDMTEVYLQDTEHMFCLGFGLAVKLLSGALSY